eukprot:CAMPEP_0175141404 /NCGR_PEP_ID=MMETSP0087-20121206/12107_1 /TAXON_ID=136419 /ORGANISM="Unknown Unknown, Strain D1" /LENGTH=461 /DNA_ID=CAMNT_0016424857 /DNA_START=110 /DNA_END=1495 /DNA_ORIENTATION=+
MAMPLLDKGVYPSAKFAAKPEQSATTTTTNSSYSAVLRAVRAMQAERHGAKMRSLHLLRLHDMQVRHEQKVRDEAFAAYEASLQAQLASSSDSEDARELDMAELEKTHSDALTARLNRELLERAQEAVEREKQTWERVEQLRLTVEEMRRAKENASDQSQEELIVDSKMQLALLRKRERELLSATQRRDKYLEWLENPKDIVWEAWEADKHGPEAFKAAYLDAAGAGYSSSSSSDSVADDEGGLAAGTSSSEEEDGKLPQQRSGVPASRVFAAPALADATAEVRHHHELKISGGGAATEGLFNKFQNEPNDFTSAPPLDPKAKMQFYLDMPKADLPNPKEVALMSKTKLKVREQPLSFQNSHNVTLTLAKSRSAAAPEKSPTHPLHPIPPTRYMGSRFREEKDQFYKAPPPPKLPAAPPDPEKDQPASRSSKLPKRQATSKAVMSQRQAQAQAALQKKLNK